MKDYHFIEYANTLRVFKINKDNIESLNSLILDKEIKFVYIIAPNYGFDFKTRQIVPLHNAKKCLFGDLIITKKLKMTNCEIHSIDTSIVPDLHNCEVGSLNLSGYLGKNLNGKINLTNSINRVYINNVLKGNLFVECESCIVLNSILTLEVNCLRKLYCADSTLSLTGEVAYLEEDRCTFEKLDLKVTGNTRKTYNYPVIHDLSLKRIMLFDPNIKHMVDFLDVSNQHTKQLVSKNLKAKTLNMVNIKIDIVQLEVNNTYILSSSGTVKYLIAGYLRLEKSNLHIPQANIKESIITNNTASFILS